MTLDRNILGGDLEIIENNLDINIIWHYEFNNIDPY